jgi:hypothetical protein
MPISRSNYDLADDEPGGTALLVLVMKEHVSVFRLSTLSMENVGLAQVTRSLQANGALVVSQYADTYLDFPLLLTKVSTRQHSRSMRVRYEFLFSRELPIWTV